MKTIAAAVLAAILCLSFCACAAKPQPTPAPQTPDPEPLVTEAPNEPPEAAVMIEAEEEAPATVEEPEKIKAPVLLYMGHSSLRILTAEDKVIYIDPYAGEGYELPADLILVTHDHFDHNAVNRIENRSEDCTVITSSEALEDGAYQVFELPYVTVEAVEAGYNRFHDVRKCVGYVLTFSNGISLYVSGDTSTTVQMEELAERKLDYAFFCCDGVYNMGLEEAAKCAETVGARHSIPYHVTSTDSGKIFDSDRAERFDAPGRLILSPGEELELK